MDTTTKIHRVDDVCTFRVWRVTESRRKWIRAVGPSCFFATLALAPTEAWAQQWRIEPSIGLQETLTNNVDLQPSSVRRGDLVTEITPSVSVREKGARTNLAGTIAVPILLYARTGSENNQVYPQVNLLGDAELVDRFFYVEGSASVSQQFLTPFGPQPDSLTSVTDNRYTAQVYRFTPYIKGVMRDNIRYELRNDNIWSNLSDTPNQVDGFAFDSENSYTNVVTGRIVRDPTPFGWGADYDRSNVRFDDQGAQLMELGRLLGLYKPDTTLELSVRGGYERNDFPFSQYQGAIYGVGLKWQPSPTTSAQGFWEHRFFGSSYDVSIDYRTPLSVWNVRASRYITSYPEQIASLRAGANVSTLLNDLLSSRIVDPIQREQAVEQIIRNRGLPETLTGPVSLYSQQITLLQGVSASVGLLGARNSVFLTAFHTRNEPIAGSGEPIPPELSGLNNNTQTGLNLAWTLQLTALARLTTLFNWSRVVPNAPLGNGDESRETTNQGTVQTAVGTLLSPRTSLYAGVRYQVQRSNLPDSGYNEAAAFVGMNYRFR